MEEFLKTLHAFHGPDDVFGGTAYMFSSRGEGCFWEPFGDGARIVPSLDQEQFLRPAGIWFVCSEARSVWKAKKDGSAESESPWLERRWMFFFALGTVLRLEMGDKELDEYLIRMGSGSWTRKSEGRAEKAEMRNFREQHSTY